MKRSRQRAGSWLVFSRLCLIVGMAAALAALTAALTWGVALAVEPGEIALNIDDLPPGFAPDPQFTRDGSVENIGPSRQVQYEREPTPANLTDGPVVVGQIVIRLDSGVGAGDALEMMRQLYVERLGFEPTDAGPNDGGTFTLQKTENGLDYVMVGFIKENMIIVTLAAGLPDVVTYPGVLDLAGITSARLDSKLGH